MHQDVGEKIPDHRFRAARAKMILVKDRTYRGAPYQFGFGSEGAFDSHARIA